MIRLKSISGAKAFLWGLALMFGLAAASSANAATLKLISLKCFTPEDSEVDEAKLRITGEGHNTSLRRNMKAGTVWYLNECFKFSKKITVRLYDVDGGLFDPDDYLGGVTIESALTHGIRTVTFNRDGAWYELKYRVDP